MKPRIPDPTMKDATQFVHWSEDLLDSEAQEAVSIIASVQRKYATRPNTVDNLEECRDEVLTRLMEIGILAEFDPTPAFYGEPPIVEIRGKISADPIHKYGFDHEKKGYEVNKAKDRGEEYLGQKERPDSRKKSG